MHELSVCQGIIDQVERIATEHGAGLVTKIFVQIGPLSGVEAELLERAFSIAREGSVARHAQLVMEHLPIIVRCNQCGNENTAKVNDLLCKACGSWQTHLISGDEMILSSLELQQDDQEQADIEESEYV